MRLRPRRLTEHGIVPSNARLIPDDPRCRLAGHRGLRWTEETDHPKRGATRIRIVAAQCTDCGHPQQRVRVVYPPDHVINVVGAGADDRGGDSTAPDCEGGGADG